MNKPKNPARDERAADARDTPPKDQRRPRASEEQMPDEAAAGRDRLSENERRPMDPGVSDSSHA